MHAHDRIAAAKTRKLFFYAPQPLRCHIMVAAVPDPAALCPLCAFCVTRPLPGRLCGGCWRRRRNARGPPASARLLSRARA